MALRYSLEADKSAVGLACPEAYARVVAVRFVTTPSEQVEVVVETHATEGARRAGRVPVASQVYGVAVGKAPAVVALADAAPAAARRAGRSAAARKNGAGAPTLDDFRAVRAALYAWVKTLPDFAGAADA
jgi:hypothetical protein